MEPFAWAGAGSAPYNNIIGIDPELMDPENGDYRVTPGSPAEGYGCRTFRRGWSPPQDVAPIALARPVPISRDEIEVSGPISEDTTWNVDLVRVVGDVTIEDGVTLTIAPGVRVEFEDYYSLSVAGTILAVGEPEAPIIFTTDDPQAFQIDDSHAGCWNGIRFDCTSAANVPSRLSRCVIEYSKATGDGGGGVGGYPYGGGAISLVDFSNLTIDSCIIRNNVADYGGAIFCYRSANPVIAGNLIINNHAVENAAAVYCGYSHPLLINNTITGNQIHNENNPYIESCAVRNFISKPVFANNIIRVNDPDVVYMHAQLWNNKNYYTHYNNIEDYYHVGGNIDADPRFVDPATGDYRLSPGSPCIDAGDNTSVPMDVTTDLDGNSRFVDDPDTQDTGFGDPPLVDMGAYELQVDNCPADVNSDDVVDIDDLFQILGMWGDCDDPGDCLEDLNHDGKVDIEDVFDVLAAWGPCPRQGG